MLRIVWIVAVALPFWPSLNGVLTCYPLSWAFTQRAVPGLLFTGGLAAAAHPVQEAAETAPGGPPLAEKHSAGPRVGPAFAGGPCEKSIDKPGSFG